MIPFSFSFYFKLNTFSLNNVKTLNLLFILNNLFLLNKKTIYFLLIFYHSSYITLDKNKCKVTTAVYKNNLKTKLLSLLSNNFYLKKINFKNKINNFFLFKIIKYKNLEIIFKTNFIKFALKNINNFHLFFIRKNKVFNKGRYSRNRQFYRTGVY